MLKKTIGMSGATHVDMFGKARKSAFTLAEVLITLGIIGVVAAMTMPTLINSTNGAQYKTAYKKALSVMSQAVVMNIALDDYDLSQTIAGTNGAEADHNDETQTLYTLFKNRMNVVKVTDADALEAEGYKIIDAGDTTDIPDQAHFGGTSGGTDTSGGGTTGGAAPIGALSKTVASIAPASSVLAIEDAAAAANAGKWTALTTGDLPTWTYMFFNDGIMFMFDNTQADCHAATKVQNDAYCSGYIDVNGTKGPNKVVRCDTGSISGAGTDEATCTVSNPTDIYPIMFYDQSIVPASAAARAVLYAK